MKYPLKRTGTGRLHLNQLERNDRHLDDCQSTFQLASRKCTNMAYLVWSPDKDINCLIFRWNYARGKNKTKRKNRKRRKERKTSNEIVLTAIDEVAVGFHRIVKQKHLSNVFSHHILLQQVEGLKLDIYQLLTICLPHICKVLT